MESPITLDRVIDQHVEDRLVLAKQQATVLTLPPKIRAKYREGAATVIAHAVRDVELAITDFMVEICDAAALGDTEALTRLHRQAHALEAMWAAVASSALEKADALLRARE